MTVSDLITEALVEIRYARAGDTLAPDDATTALAIFNRLLDAWNAERRAVYASAFATYVVTPNLQPHTIGPSGTFTVTQRPVSLDGASCILNVGTSAQLNLPVVLRDAEWWNSQRTPRLANQLWTDLYYQADWPNGSIYLWPIPTIAYSLQLQTRVLLAEVALTDTFTLPPGYREALTLTLAEQLASPFGQILAPQTVQFAAMARARIFANNDSIPNIHTRDSGMPQSRGKNRTQWNYRIGGNVPGGGAS